MIITKAVSLRISQYLFIVCDLLILGLCLAMCIFTIGDFLSQNCERSSSGIAIINFRIDDGSGPEYSVYLVNIKEYIAHGL